ncbi:MAG: hypothetical protein M3R63_07990 [Actinomycetota bacterium]|nr:hypothetical protein [Actinomycetota bacterium]
MSRPQDPWGSASGWPGGGRAPRHRRSNGPFAAAVAGVVALVVLAVVAVATIEDSPGQALGTPSAAPAPPPATGPATTQLPGPSSSPETTDTAEGIDVAAGECVRFLVATDEEAQVAPAQCSAPEASHIVVDRVANRAECPGDIDVTYYETRLAVETLALCMDVNWMIGTCYDITDGPAATEAVACTSLPDRRVRKVEAVVEGTTSVDQCTDNGIVYGEREFVICVRMVE